MSDTATIIVSAFAGGLAGAVLQPILAYFIGRLQAADQVRKARQRTIRRMLFDYIRYTRRVQAWALTATPSSGRSPRSETFWEPHRIEDAALRKAVDEYNRLSAQILVRGLRRSFGEDVSKNEIEKIDEDLNSLQVAITERMDQLNFPETDGE